MNEKKQGKKIETNSIVFSPVKCQFIQLIHFTNAHEAQMAENKDKGEKGATDRSNITIKRRVEKVLREADKG